jgi:lysophospholipase L1-like esterase
VTHNKQAKMKKQRWLAFLVLFLLLFCTACATSSPSSNVSNSSKAGLAPTIAVTPTPQLASQLSAQQVLSQPLVYVAMGASDALGVGSERPATQGYIPRITTKLPQGSQAVNVGISGVQLKGALTKELPRTLAAQPRLITIWLVANDFVASVNYDDYMQDLESLLNELRTGTHSRIIMGNLPDLTLLPRFAQLSPELKQATQRQIERWNIRIGEIAETYHVTVVDLYSQGSEITSHPSYVSKDGFHPSAAGYSRLAEYFWAGISRNEMT